MPHSVFTGRPMPGAGEPLFLPDDTNAALALAEEERDTCPSCGYPKAICRDPNGRAFFDIEEDFCWATYRAALRQGVLEKALPETRAATQVMPRLREGYAPPIDAGLDLGAEVSDGPEDGAEQGEEEPPLQD